MTIDTAADSIFNKQVCEHTADDDNDAQAQLLRSVKRPVCAQSVRGSQNRIECNDDKGTSDLLTDLAGLNLRIVTFLEVKGYRKLTFDAGLASSLNLMNKLDRLALVDCGGQINADWLLSLGVVKGNLISLSITNPTSRTPGASPPTVALMTPAGESALDGYVKLKLIDLSGTVVLFGKNVGTVFQKTPLIETIRMNGCGLLSPDARWRDDMNPATGRSLNCDGVEPQATAEDLFAANAVCAFPVPVDQSASAWHWLPERLFAGLGSSRKSVRLTVELMNNPGLAFLPASVIETHAGISRAMKAPKDTSERSGGLEIRTDMDVTACGALAQPVVPVRGVIEGTGFCMVRARRRAGGYSWFFLRVFSFVFAFMCAWGVVSDTSLSGPAWLTPSRGAAHCGTFASVCSRHLPTGVPSTFHILPNKGE